MHIEKAEMKDLDRVVEILRDGRNQLAYCRTKVVWACSVALFVACQWVWRRIHGRHL